MREKSTLLGEPPPADARRRVSTSRDGVSTTFQSCQSLALGAVSAAIGPLIWRMLAVISCAFLTFCVALGLSAFEAVSAEECLTTPQQLLEKKVGDRWKEIHQKDNQPLFLTISAGQANELQFVGKKPDGSTWISGAVSVCSYAGNNYQVKLDHIDEAPLFVGQKLRGMSDTIRAGSSHLKFGTGKRCGNPDPCIEFSKE
jgi:hypothetical protein